MKALQVPPKNRELIARFFVGLLRPELPDAMKQTRNRARLLLATPQCRLALRNTLSCGGGLRVAVICYSSDT